MGLDESKPVRSLRALVAFLFRDLSREEFGRLFRRDAPALLEFHLRSWDEAGVHDRGRIARFFSKVRFLAGRILALMPPARRFLFLLAFLLAVVSMSVQSNLPLYAFAIMAFLLILELTEKLLARDEIEIAREVQRSLFPRSDPPVEGWTLASRNLPANDVGGDYYDYVSRPGAGRLGIALGDVAGKGMGAALLVANLQATLRAFLEADGGPGPAGAVGSDPDERSRALERIFSSLNRALSGTMQSNRFASLVYGELDLPSGRIDYVNAGQNPPMVVRGDGQLVTLPPGGMVLGVAPDADYRAGSITLQPGDSLVLYCDGITERFNAEGVEFGEERLEKVLRLHRGRPATVIRDAILDAVERHAEGTPPHDDRTVVIVSRNGEPAP